MTKTDDEVNRELMETGWFAELDGPEGQYPVQAFGELRSGTRVYFRARGARATLELSPPEGQGPDRTFMEVVGPPPSASIMSPADCAVLIMNWLTRYFEETEAERHQAQSEA